MLGVQAPSQPMLTAPTVELGDQPLLASVPAMGRFSKRKRYHDPLAKLIALAPELAEYARSIANCGNCLKVLLELPEGGDPFAMLTEYNPCNRRACPMCEWRRSLVWRGRLLSGLDAFFAAHPTHRAIFVTLTAKTVPFHALGDEIKHLHLSWQRLTQCSFFPSPFWFRRTEVTRANPSRGDDGVPIAPTAKNAGRRPPTVGDGAGTTDAATPDTDTAMPLYAHPHIHALILVPASYWGKGYIKQGEWQRQWMMAARLPYAPVVDVRKARATFTTGEAFYDAKAAGIEAMKYTIKAADMTKMGRDLPEFVHQMRGHRLVAMSQGLRRFVPEHDPTAKEMGDDREAGLPRLHPGVMCLAQWDRTISDYVLTPAEGG
jgi:hypothetical protein